jgi:hypothetical protein
MATFEQNDIMQKIVAYGRSAVSRWFRESMADLLMQTLPFPLFIAHNK